MLKVLTTHQIKSGYLIAYLLIFAAFLLSLYFQAQVIYFSESSESSKKILLTQEHLSNQVKELESIFRGIVILGVDAALLKKYRDTKKEIHEDFEVLRLNTIDNTLHQQSLIKIQSLLNTQIDRLDLGIGVFHQTSSDELKRITKEGMEQMEKLRKEIKAMQQREEARLDMQTSKFKSAFRIAKPTTLTAFLITTMLAIFSIAIYTREHFNRRQADQRAKEYAKELELRVQELKRKNTELNNLRYFEKFVSAGRLAQTVGHEIRNPLNNIDMAASQMEMDLGSRLSDQNKKLLEIVKRNSHRINQLVADLLSSTKEHELKLEEIRLDDFMEMVLAEAEDRMKLLNIQVTKKIHDPDCKLKVDTTKLKLALLNIIINAIEAMSETTNGQLTIQTKSNNGKCVLYITDNGPGMDQESLNRLFEPYFTSKKKGTGLGLTHTQNIILSHGGSTEATSIPGKGATFIITLNIHRENAKIPAQLDLPGIV